MYTNEEVNALVQLFEAQRVAEEKLECFCRHIAAGFNFDTVTRVGIMDEEVFFTAEWYGPYQSSDTETFYFPAKLLVAGEDAVYEYLDEKRKKEKNEQRAIKEQQREHEEKQLLASLKQKYEA